MTIYFGIFYDGKQLGQALPEYEAMALYKEMSFCLRNLDLRILEPAEIKLKAVR